MIGKHRTNNARRPLQGSPGVGYGSAALCPLVSSPPPFVLPLGPGTPWSAMYKGGGTSVASQNFRNVYFLETKSPCGVAPNIEEGLRIYPKKINSFLQKSGKVGFLQKYRN